MVKEVKERFGTGGKLRAVPTMDFAIEWDAYNWLNTHAPEYLTCVEQSIEAGFEPEEIRAYVNRQAADRQIAARCEQAARYLIRLVEEG